MLKEGGISVLRGAAVTTQAANDILRSRPEIQCSATQGLAD